MAPSTPRERTTLGSHNTRLLSFASLARKEWLQELSAARDCRTTPIPRTCPSGMTLAARTPSLQLLKEVGIFVTRDKNEVTIRLWINLSTRTTYAVRCMSQHDPKPHVHNLRTGPRDDVFTGIPFVTRKDRAIEMVRDHRFSGS